MGLGRLGVGGAVLVAVFRVWGVRGWELGSIMRE